MHVKEAKIHGERELRLHHVTIWRESTLFSARERAALEWTETLTRLEPHGVSDEIFNRVRERLSDEELADLSFLVISINGWNRLSVAFLWERVYPRRMRRGAWHRLYRCSRVNPLPQGSPLPSSLLLAVSNPWLSEQFPLESTGEHAR
nr:hypothetical protein [Pseudomonas capeferrum]